LGRSPRFQKLLLIQQTLIKIIAKILDVNENEISKTSKFIDDLGAG
jgi:acyl carrier protein